MGRGSPQARPLRMALAGRLGTGAARPPRPAGLLGPSKSLRRETVTIFANFLYVIAMKRQEILTLAVATVIMTDNQPETSNA